MRLVYRILPTSRQKPGVEDFCSYKALGQVPYNNTPDTLRYWDGISVYDDVLTATAKAMGKPWRGKAVLAELAVPDHVRIERSFLNSPGHHTIWGEPEELLSYVVRVVPLYENVQD